MTKIIFGPTLAGKTMLHQLVLKKTKFTSFDLDKEIEKTVSMSCGLFILKYGVEKFRALEQKVLSDLILKKPDFIFLGGGFISDHSNRVYLKTLSKNDYTLVYLKLTYKEFIKRQNDISNQDTRPLLNKDKTFYLKRTLVGKKLKCTTVDVFNQSPETILTKIIEL